MADMAMPVALQAVNHGCNHYHTIRTPIQRKLQKMQGKMPREDPDLRDTRLPDEKGMVLRKRCEVRSDEEIVEVVRHRGQVLPRRPGTTRPGMVRGTSSMGDMRENNRRDRGGGSSDGYDSEGSVPPRNRVRPQSANGRRRGGGGGSSSSSDTSSIGSSTDEEKECGKMRRKKWITAALATVATIHAGSKVYSSIESHDKRIIQVQKGELSPEEANKKQRAARWQDAAAIGIAALGIKGAISEWKEVQEEHAEHKEMMEKREEHHKKRIERARRMKAREQTGYYKGRDGNWYYDGPDPQYSDPRRQKAIDGPRNGSQLMLENGGNRDRSNYGGRDKSRSRNDYAYARDQSPDDRDRDYSRRRRDRDDYNDR